MPPLAHLRIAVEAALDEEVLRRLLRDLRPDIQVLDRLGLRGWTYLQAKAPGLNQAAASYPCLMLTDLDARPSACGLVHCWLPQRHGNFVLRVAVRKVESWLLADRGNLAAFLAVPVTKVPPAPEGLPDPKQALVNLARRSRRRSVREAIVPLAGSTAQEGPKYTGCLSEFVRSHWNWQAACGDMDESSTSLARAVRAIKGFAPTIAEVPP